MIRYIILILLIFCFSCNTNKNSKAVRAIKNYDTLPNGQKLLDNSDSSMEIYYRNVVGSDTLKGGYITCYGIDDSKVYFYLRHGDTLHLLNTTPTNTLAWSAGILESDYKNCFIIMIDNGNQVPTTYQIFDKNSSENMLGNNQTFCSYKFYRNKLFLIYANRDMYGKPDTVFFYSTSTKQSKSYKLPNDIPNELELEIKRISQKTFTINYSDFMGNYNLKEKTYNR